AALINLAWAGGQIVGSGGGGALAKADGDGLPLAIVAAACGLTLAVLVTVRGTRDETAAQHGGEITG
ncbi:MAG TPA: hypothetical protein VIJ20_11355, partial [Solirubrobacteraceae bacterium]